MSSPIQRVISGLMFLTLIVSSRPAHAQGVSGLLPQPEAARDGIIVTRPADLLSMEAGITSAGLQGQTSRQSSGGAQGFGVGAKIGPVFSTLSGGVTNFSSRSGLMGGIWFGGNRGGYVGVMGEIMYAKKGAKDPAGNPSDLYYLEIPILLRINAGSSSRNGISVYGLLGPVADIKLKAKQKGVDVSSNYEALDIGIIAGAGVEVTRILVEGQFNWGLRTVNKGNLNDTTKIKNKSFALLFGLRFN